MGIRIDYGGASFRDWTWQETGGVDVKEGIYFEKCTQNLHDVNLDVGREVSR